MPDLRGSSLKCLTVLVSVGVLPGTDPARCIVWSCWVTAVLSLGGLQWFQPLI